MPAVIWLPGFEVDDGKPLHFTTTDRKEAEAHLERGAILGARPLLFKLKLDKGWLYVERVKRNIPHRIASNGLSGTQTTRGTHGAGKAAPSL